MFCVAFLRLRKEGIFRNFENLDIRIKLEEANLKFYQVARKLNITRPSFSRKLRYKLSQKEKDRVLQAIEELKKEIN